MDNTELNCWTCEPLRAYGELASNFSTSLAVELQAPMNILFVSFTGLWIVLAGYKIALEAVQYSGLAISLIYVVIAWILLGSQGASLIENVYNATLQIMTSSSEVAFKVAGGEIPRGYYTGLPALSFASERAIGSVFDMASNILASGRFVNPIRWIYAIVLILPYFLLIIAYASQVVVAIFRVMVIAVLAPFLFMSFAFGWGQGMAQAGVKTLIASVLVLFASTTALAVTIYFINSFSVEELSAKGADLGEFVSIRNSKFLLTIFIGWAGTAFMAEGTSIANSIAGSSLTNVATGIMTAGLGSAGLATFGASKGAIGFGLTAGSRFSDAKSAIAKDIQGFRELTSKEGWRDLYHQIKDVNKKPKTPERDVD